MGPCLAYGTYMVWMVDDLDARGTSAKADKAHPVRPIEE